MMPTAAGLRAAEVVTEVEASVADVSVRAAKEAKEATAVRTAEETMARAETVAVAGAHSREDSAAAKAEVETEDSLAMEREAAEMVGAMEEF